MLYSPNCSVMLTAKSPGRKQGHSSVKLEKWDPSRSDQSDLRAVSGWQRDLLGLLCCWYLPFQSFWISYISHSLHNSPQHHPSDCIIMNNPPVAVGNYGWLYSSPPASGTKPLTTKPHLQFRIHAVDQVLLWRQACHVIHHSLVGIPGSRMEYPVYTSTPSRLLQKRASPVLPWSRDWLILADRVYASTALISHLAGVSDTRQS